MGLFATKHIRAGLLIPYTGRLVKTDVVHSTNNYQTSHTHDGDYGLSTDALASPECDENYCIASFANEASALTLAEQMSRAPEERYNCKFVELSCPEDYMRVPHMPAYMLGGNDEAELWDRMHQPFVLVCTSLAPGEQLFVSYEATEPTAEYEPLPIVDGEGRYINIKDPGLFKQTLHAFEQATVWTVPFQVAS